MNLYIGCPTETDCISLILKYKAHFPFWSQWQEKKEKFDRLTLLFALKHLVSHYLTDTLLVGYLKLSNNDISIGLKSVRVWMFRYVSKTVIS